MCVLSVQISVCVMNMNTVSLPAGLAGDHLQLDSDLYSSVSVCILRASQFVSVSVVTTSGENNKNKIIKNSVSENLGACLYQFQDFTSI